jgi:hypothetical protein
MVFGHIEEIGAPEVLIPFLNVSVNGSGVDGDFDF